MVTGPGVVTVRVRLALCVRVAEVPVTVRVTVPVAAVVAAVSVKVELAVPPAAGVTGLAEKAAVTPAGRPDTLRVVAELNPLTLVTVVVVLPLPPWTTLTDVGETPIVKSATGVAWTTSVTEVVCVSEPLVPVIVIGKLPVGVVVAVAMLSADDVPVAGFGENVAVAPAGSPLAERVTAA